MKVLIVEDSLDKITQILSALRTSVKFLNVDTCEDIRGAKKLLLKNEYDLLICDLNIPLDKDTEPIQDGGKILVKEIRRNQRLNKPSYIIGITQFEELESNFDQLWVTLKYDPKEESWKESLIEFISHIESSKSHDQLYNSNKVLFFVEGCTDKLILEEALRVYFPEFVESIYIVCSFSSGGATWVIRQLLAKSYEQRVNDLGEKLNVIGLVDGDSAGDKAISELNRVIPSNPKLHESIKVIQLKTDECAVLKSLCSKNLKIPVAIEELSHVSVFRKALEKGYLEYRDIRDLLINPKKWDHENLTSRQYLETLKLTDEEKLKLYKVKKDKKSQFLKIVTDYQDEIKELLLINYKGIVEKVLRKSNLLK